MHDMDFVVNIIKQYWSPGKKILEVGCGRAMLRDVFGKDYIGTDITNTDYLPGVPRSPDVVCSADNLLFDNESVNMVVIKSAFFLFPDKCAAVREALRVLKPGGKLVIFDYNKRTQKILQQKEAHNNYPCWTQWGLKNLIKQNGFNQVKLYIGQSEQPVGIRKYYHLLRQELLGTWAIVSATKS